MPTQIEWTTNSKVTGMGDFGHRNDSVEQKTVYYTTSDSATLLTAREPVHVGVSRISAAIVNIAMPPAPPPALPNGSLLFTEAGARAATTAQSRSSTLGKFH